MKITTLKKRLSILLFSIFFSTSTMAMPTDPILVEYHLSGLGHAPEFTPQKLHLYVGKAYLFMIDNPFEYDINFFYDKFGKTVYTHYLKGVPGVSQNGMTIPAKTKVTWLFELNQPGDFQVYAINTGMGQRGAPSHLIVQPLHKQGNPSNIQNPYQQALNQASEASPNEAEQQAKEQPKLTLASRNLRKPKFHGGRRD